MQYGLHVFGHHARDRPPEENFADMVAQARAAREAGFDLLWAGHHYLIERWQKFQVVPAISRLAAEAGEMHVGTSLLLPLHHPVVIAEQFATLDAMTGGRAILGPVAGYREAEFDAMGVPKADRFDRLVEGVEAIERLWTEDGVTVEGEHFAFEDATITPKPVQDPRPPIWVGANADAAVERASRLGDAWLANPHADLGTIERQLGLARTPDGPGMAGIQPCRREVFVAETDEAALETYGEAVKAYYEFYDDIGQGEAMADPDALSLALDRLKQDHFIIGSPETVADELVDLHAIGVDCPVMAMHMPGLDREDVVRSIELAGSAVIPRVEERIG